MRRLVSTCQRIWFSGGVLFNEVLGTSLEGWWRIRVGDTWFYEMGLRAAK